jgi:hypothetical protein
VLAVSAVTGAAGCDQGRQHDEPRVGSTYVSLVGDNTANGIPADGVIELAFDRQLLPVTVNRQSFTVRDASGNGLSPVVKYDPVARIVQIVSPNPDGGAWLTPQQEYTVTLGIPSGDDDSGGVRAIDRATLDPSVSHVISFFARIVGGDGGTAAPPTISFCTDVFPIFQAKCSSGLCHGGLPNGAIEPAAGLLLDSPDGIRHTAIGVGAQRVAQGSNTGALAASGPLGHHFGVDMPIIDPGPDPATGGDPGNSWIIYKMLLAVPNDVAAPGAAACDGGTSATTSLPPDPLRQPLSDDERARLADFVLGREMPFPDDPGAVLQGVAPSTSITFDELERVELWIAQGAHVDDCTCGP